MRKFISIVCTLYFPLASFSEVRLPRLISNGMVLQRNVKIPLWGWASPNELVTVHFKEMFFRSRADKKGSWSIQLPPQRAGGPYQIDIKGSNEINLSDILIGDVWICSGQSNMELTMERVKYKYPEEMNADNTSIRQFIIPDKYDFTSPQDDVASGSWLAVNKKNLPQFSAVAYFFARDLYAIYQVPVGLINSALGGSPAEAWISEAALKKFPAYYQELQKFKSPELINTTEQLDHVIAHNWYQQLNETDEGIRNNWINPALEDSGWKTINVPGYINNTAAEISNGSVWFKRSFELPVSMIGKPAKLELGRIVDADSAFINGQFVGTTGYQYPPRRYEVIPGVLKAGKNNITIRLISTNGRGGFVRDKPYRLSVSDSTIDLTGSWKYRTGSAMRELPAQTVIRWKPAGLYNAMIAPLTRYPIKGVIWYQGEANAARPGDYKALMQTLIADWRTRWNQGAFPFLYVQLANFMEAVAAPQSSNWAALRQQQLKTLSVRNTGMALAIDAGEWNDIHPENKKIVGGRLALLARQIAYGDKQVMASGPLYRSSEIHGNRIIVHFTNAGTGLVTKDATDLRQFAIAGRDKKYAWAKAFIRGNTVLVWNDTIPHPVSVRYAWADNPEGANLYNREGLPASPFTTEK